MILLPLVLALFSQAAFAQTGYAERVVFPTPLFSDVPHDAPRTYDVSAQYSNTRGQSTPGSVTVTFVSTPAPSVLARALSDETAVIVVGQLDYDFFYSGAPLSHVPIHFQGLFSLVHGLALFNRSEVGVSLSTMALDRSGSEFAGMQLNCAQTCGFFQEPTASGASGIRVDYSARDAATAIDSASANGSFAGTMMGATDANGQGQGRVSLHAFASAASSRLSTAFIDPWLSIDASYLAAHPEASLTLPPGVGNAVTAVPEPQTLALMLAGLAALATGLRRRRAG